MTERLESAVSPSDADERVRHVELVISNLLRGGVFASLALIVAGTIISFIHHPEYFSSPGDFERLVQPGAAFPHTVAEVLQGILLFRGQAIVTAGLLLLIATPVMRVAVSIFAFIYQDDRTFTYITAVVLFLLLLSFFLGKVE